MKNPVEYAQNLIKDRPKELRNTPPSMRRWMGRLSQSYGMMAQRLEDLQAEHAAAKEKVKDLDIAVQTYEGMIEVRELVILNHLNRLKAVRKELMRNLPVVSPEGMTYSIKVTQFPKLIRNLWEALGDHDPRTEKCLTCQEVCRDYSTRMGCPKPEGGA